MINLMNDYFLPYSIVCVLLSLSSFLLKKSGMSQLIMFFIYGLSYIEKGGGGLPPALDDRNLGLGLPLVSHAPSDTDQGSQLYSNLVAPHPGAWARARAGRRRPRSCAVSGRPWCASRGGPWRCAGHSAWGGTWRGGGHLREGGRDDGAEGKVLHFQPPIYLCRLNAAQEYPDSHGGVPLDVRRHDVPKCRQGVVQCPDYP